MSQGPQQLRDWLERRHFNQRETAEYLSTDEAMLSSWLSGRRRPGLEHVINIERLTGVPVEAWVSSDPDESVEPQPRPVPKLNLSKV